MSDRHKKRKDFHADGSLKAEGWVKAGKLHGLWKWYRRNGVIMRSGRFRGGKQVGEWVTYDSSGKKYKVTHFGN